MYRAPLTSSINRVQGHNFNVAPPISKVEKAREEILLKLCLHSQTRVVYKIHGTSYSGDTDQQLNLQYNNIQTLLFKTK